VSGVRGFSVAVVDVFAVGEVETDVGGVGVGVGAGEEVLVTPHDTAATAATVAATSRWEGRVMLG